MNSATEIDKLLQLFFFIGPVFCYFFIFLFFWIIHVLPMYYLDLGTDVNGVSGV